MSAVPSKRSREDSECSSTVPTLVADLTHIAESEREKRKSTLVPVAHPAYSTAFRECLDRIAAYLLHDVTIQAGDARFGIREVEMYAKLENVYEDRFTHCDAQQGFPGTWYFHKKGGTYKAGSFKGLDITFGNSKVGVWCGGLIRTIQNLTTNEEIEGPSLTVDAILAATKKANIASLVGGTDRHLVVSESFSGAASGGELSPLLKLLSVPSSATRVQVLRAPRVGLVPRSDDDLLFAGRLLRFFPFGTRLKKQRSGIVAALLVDGMERKADEIAMISGCRKGMIVDIRGHMTVGDHKLLLGADVMQTPIIAGIVGYSQKVNAL